MLEGPAAGIRHRFRAFRAALSVLCAASLVALAAGAQEPDREPEPDADVPGIRVTDSGNRVVYLPEYFSEYNVISARDMLDRIPGIQGLLGGGGFGGGGRGFGSSGDQVLINGKRLSGKFNDVGSTVGRIQARQVRQIEVIRGTVDGLDVRSRGRVVNLVLNEALVTGFGSWEASWSRYSDGRNAPGAEVNYSGHLGALNYVVSGEADRRHGRTTGSDLFYAPDGALFERQEEVETDESDELSFTANTSYALPNGDILNLNGFYSQEDENEQELSERFRVTPDEETFMRDVSIAGEDERSDWELGGDYERVLGSGNVLTGLFVVSSSSGDQQSRLAFTRDEEERGLDELQTGTRHSSERILRGTYDWGATDTRSFESGAEVAINTVDRSIRLLEDSNGDGALEETPLFNQASEVQETRVEAFTTYTWQGRDDLLLEASLDLEASELSQEGADVSRSRDFFFARPRINFRYDVSDQTQLRARIERTVNQLNFGAFTASFTNDDNRLDVISAGNPELVPEQAWEYELTYERRLRGDAGFVSVTGTFRDVEDKEARIPLLVRSPDGALEERTAPGNIGDGTQLELELNASLRLGWLNLDRAVLEGSVEISDTEVTDPFTGERREFAWVSPYGWRLSFRHDTSWRGLSYGLETGDRDANEQFDLDYRQIGDSDPDIELFAEMQPLENLTLRLEVEELLRAENERERFQYAGNRGDGLLERRELRISKPMREITLSVQGVF